MTTIEVVQDVGAAVAALGVIATVLAHLPFMPAKWAEFFARFATYASQTFSVNRRDTLGPDSKASAPERARVQPSDPPGPMFPMGMLCLTLALCALCASCGLSGKGQPLAPVAACAPTPDSVIDDVAAILLAGGDYYTALENYGKGKAADFVICAVQAYLDQPTSKTGSTVSDARAQERGKAYLAEKRGTK